MPATGAGSLPELGCYGLAGRMADGVVLHTFLTARSTATVRGAAENAGRAPASVRIWAVLATIEDSVPEELRLRRLVGRLATYLEGYGDVLVRANEASATGSARGEQEEARCRTPR